MKMGKLESEKRDLNLKLLQRTPPLRKGRREELHTPDNKEDIL